MSPAIEKLVLVITALCLRINALRLFDVTLDIHGQGRWVRVVCWQPDLHPSDPAARVASLDASCDYSDYEWLTPAQQHDRCIAELEAMAARLQDILGSAPQIPDATEPTETLIPGWPPKPGALDEASVSAIAGLALAGGWAVVRLGDGRAAQLQVDRIEHPQGYALEAALTIGCQRQTLNLTPADGIYAARLCEWAESIAAGRLATAA